MTDAEVYLIKKIIELNDAIWDNDLEATQKVVEDMNANVKIDFYGSELVGSLKEEIANESYLYALRNLDLFQKTKHFSEVVRVFIDFHIFHENEILDELIELMENKEPEFIKELEIDVIKNLITYLFKIGRTDLADRVYAILNKIEIEIGVEI